MPHRLGKVLLTAAFAAILLGPGVVQIVIEGRRGKAPQALEVFRRSPTPAHLHDYETRLEDESVTIKTLRPWVQYAQFTLLRDPGSKALLGLDGWYFYRPGVEYITQRPKLEGAPSDPLRAICDFRDQLAARGIHLVVVPVPNKESVYPDRLTNRADRTSVVCAEETRRLLDRLGDANVDVVDLFGMYAMVRYDFGRDTQFYLKQDSHWSPEGVWVAAMTVARGIQKQNYVTPGSTSYETRSVPVVRLGDVLQMLRVPQIDQHTAPEVIVCQQVIRSDNQQPYIDNADSEVLVLGDSFLRIYEQDEPGSAGFIAHLAKLLKQPVASIVNDGGASTLVRQELYRRPALLANKKVVVWEFVERDIRFGMEGWQIVPLPEIPENAADEGQQ